MIGKLRRSTVAGDFAKLGNQLVLTLGSIPINYAF